MTPVTFLPTIRTFAARYEITTRFEPVNENPNLLDAPKPDARHFKVTLRSGTTGNGHTFFFTTDEGDPDILMVLDALAAECFVFEDNKAVEDLTDEEARTLCKLRDHADKVRWVLGDTAYGELVWEIRRRQSR